jgi:hypothetical protein
VNSCELELFLAIAQPSRADALISSGYFSPLRMNRRVRFGISGSTVLVASSGDQVSFNTTEGDRVKFKIFKLTAHF